MAALGAVAIAGCSDSGDSGTLHVRNNSDFEIVNIQVTPVDSSTWGPNLIDGEVLRPGQSLIIDVSCDRYDALLTDDSGAQCTVRDLDLCASTADWVRPSSVPVMSSRGPGRQGRRTATTTPIARADTTNRSASTARTPPATTRTLAAR